MTTLNPMMHPGPSPAPSGRDRTLIVHDVRSALQGVLGGVGMIDVSALPAPAREQFDRIAAASRLLSCLLDTLTGQEIPAERREAHRRVDVARLLHHLTRRWTGEARASGHRFRVVAAADAPPTISTELVSLERSLSNLIGNALRHTAGGDVTLQVRRTDDDGVAFVLRDAGPGLPPAMIAGALGPKGRTSVVGPGAMRGLGLHVVRTLCSEMGCAFALENRPAGGAEASLTFPPGMASREIPSPASGVVDLGGLRVLLAEDNPTNQIVATEMLRALNADVTLAADGVEALDRFEGGHFDLLVLDIEMPRMSGLDVIRAVRGRRDERAAVPIVALTAYAMREHRERVAAAGANGLIAKPITSVEALGEALARHVPDAVAGRPVASGSLGSAGSASAGPARRGPGGPVVDLAVFNALGDAIGADVMAELLEKVVADLLAGREVLAGAIAPLDVQPIASASHILISVAGAIGAVRLQACARELNTATYGTDHAGLPAGVAQCIDEIDAAVEFAQSRRAAG